MALQLSLAEVDKARDIAQRALNTISIREETERVNVWVARMNLEKTYGTQDSLMVLFREACQVGPFCISVVVVDVGT